jgi:hypothetical protein
MYYRYASNNALEIRCTLYYVPSHTSGSVQVCKTYHWTLSSRSIICYCISVESLIILFSELIPNIPSAPPPLSKLAVHSTLWFTSGSPHSTAVSSFELWMRISDLPTSQPRFYRQSFLEASVGFPVIFVRWRGLGRSRRIKKSKGVREDESRVVEKERRAHTLPTHPVLAIVFNHLT